MLFGKSGTDSKADVGLGRGMDIITSLIGPASFLTGILFGLAIYRILWHVDTASLREEIEREKAYNRALQDQIFELKTELQVMRGRVQTLEEVNNELMHRARR